MDKKLLKQSVKNIKLSDEAKANIIKKCRESLSDNDEPVPQKYRADITRRFALVGTCCFAAGIAITAVFFLLVGQNKSVSYTPIPETLEESVEKGFAGSSALEDYGSSSALSTNSTTAAAGHEPQSNMNPLPERSESEIGQTSGDYTPDESSLIKGITTYIMHPMTDSTEELSADMHRPDGYNPNIGSALALKMLVTDDPEYKFRVILCSYKEDMETVIEKANKNLQEKINFLEFQQNVTQNDIFPSYYIKLSAEQITLLAELDVQLFYVGTGKGDLKEMNWKTKEGINIYCERNGDNFILVSDPSAYHRQIYTYE